MNADVAGRTLSIDAFLDAPILEIAASPSTRRKARKSENVTLYQRGLMLSPLAMLAACGGGGGGGGGSTPPPPPAASVTGVADAVSVAAGTTPATGNVLSNDTTANTTGTLAVTAVAVQGGTTGTVGTPLAGTFGSIDIETNGAFTYALDTNDADYVRLGAGQTATETFTYTPSAGSTNGQATTVTVTVTGANDAPTAVADTASVTEDGTLTATGDVRANDTDPDANATLTITGVAVQGGAAGTIGQALVGIYGTLTLNADGTYTYTLDNADPDLLTLDAGETANDVFTYTLSDGTATTTGTLTITVNGANDVPTGSNIVDLGNLGDRGDVITAPAGAVNFGWSLGTGDILGAGGTAEDARFELIVGAPANDGSAPGSVYIYSFATGAPELVQTLTGLNNGDRFGYSVSGADLNGSGRLDMLVGAPGFANNGLNAGAVYGLFGDTTLTQPGSVNGTNGFVIVGAENGAPFVAAIMPSTAVGQPTAGDIGDNLGTSVAGGPIDINGDGRADFFISRPGVDSLTQEDVGISYIVFGQASYAGTIASNTLANTNVGFGITSIRSVDDAYGYTSVWAGDIDNDDVPDLIIGDPRRDTDNNGTANGGVIVLLERPNLTGGTTNFDSINGTPINGTNGVRFFTTENNAFLGASVTSADLNNDGFEDVIVGAPGAGGDGKVYILLGKASYSASDINVADPASITAAGAEVITLDGTGSLGASLTYIGDFNADGVDDVLVGAPGEGGSGRGYILLGGSSVAADTYDLATPGDRVIRLEGGDLGTGAQVEALGDINGDSADDIAIAAADGSGTIYVVYGFSTNSAASAQLTMLDLVDDNSDSLDGLIGAAAPTDVSSASPIIYEPIDPLGALAPADHLV